MKLIYSSSIDDHIAFNQWLLEQRDFAPRSWYWRISQTFRLMLSFLIVGAFVQYYTRQPQYLIYSTAAGLIVGICVFATYPRRLKGGFEKRIKNLYAGDKGQGTIFGRHTMELSPDALTERTELAETTHRLSGITGLEEMQERIFVMVGPSSAWVIPRNKIEEGDLDQFIDKLKSYLHLRSS